MNNYQTQQLVEAMTAMMMMAMGVGVVSPVMLQLATKPTSIRGERVGFTGTEVGITELQKVSFRKLIQSLEPINEFHHGDCIGSDEQAHNIVRPLEGITIHIHPPLDPKKRAFCAGDIIHKPKGYLDRNRDIVNSTDFLIATPKSKREELRSGTWATIRYARRRNKKIFIIYPDGEIHRRQYG